jgi:hypothetical protein
MKKSWLGFILALAFLLTCLAAQGESQTTTVNGVVRGNDGNPKISASVKLIGPGNYIALTNAAGAFVIERVIPGPYRITVLQGNHSQQFQRNIPGSLDLVVNW